MRDFWAFRTMVTPVIIQILFWAGVLFCIGLGLAFIGAGIGLGETKTWLSGVAVLLLGPLGVRIYCEILIIFFRINETLTEIKHLMEERRQGTS